MNNLILPYEWKARPHQEEVFRYMLDGGMERKRACEVWHRRAGKDSFALQITAVASQLRVGTYWHMLPELNQGRKVIWNGIDKFGRRMIDQAFPEAMRKGKPNESDMMIRFKNGSIWMVVGSDNYNSIVGTNPIGIIFSEYSVADPMAWDFLRPILRENDGWAVFIYTSRGKNHGYTLYEMAKNRPSWHATLLTIEDTVREDGRRIFTDEDYQEELDEGMDPEMAEQEYYCSFEAGLFGAYYNKEMKKAVIGDYPHNPAKPVFTFWDIGLDCTAIWFAQDSSDGDSINVIDYWEESNISMEEWIRRINTEKYHVAWNVGPHDVKKRDWTDKRSYLTKASEDFGFYFEVAPHLLLSEGIDAVKTFIPRCRFNEGTTKRGIDTLTNYRRMYDEKLKVFKEQPLHDWASHGADAFRYMALGYPEDFDFLSREDHTMESLPGVITSTGRRNVPERPGRHSHYGRY